MRDTELSQANTSRQLQMLHGLGFVERRKEGLYVLYRLADESVMTMCDVMCGRLEQQLDSERRMFS